MATFRKEVKLLWDKSQHKFIGHFTGGAVWLQLHPKIPRRGIMSIFFVRDGESYIRSRLPAIVANRFFEVALFDDKHILEVEWNGDDKRRPDELLCIVGACSVEEARKSALGFQGG